MTIHDELVRPAACKLCRYISGRPGPEREEWREAMAADDVGHTRVVEYLAERGTILNEASVRRHRNASH